MTATVGLDEILENKLNELSTVLHKKISFNIIVKKLYNIKIKLQEHYHEICRPKE